MLSVDRIGTFTSCMPADDVDARPAAQQEARRRGTQETRPALVRMAPGHVGGAVRPRHDLLARRFQLLQPPLHLLVIAAIAVGPPPRNRNTGVAPLPPSSATCVTRLSAAASAAAAVAPSDMPNTSTFPAIHPRLLQRVVQRRAQVAQPVLQREIAVEGIGAGQRRSRCASRRLGRRVGLIHRHHRILTRHYHRHEIENVGGALGRAQPGKGGECSQNPE